jgi:hypothetical protein
MTKPLTIGDLVWYNVGGRGYETMGLVIETADLWQEKQAWDRGDAKKYANCVRIKWMRVGKLKPRTIRLPLYRQMIKMTYEDMNQIAQTHNGFAEWERSSILNHMGEVETGEWYEGHFFKSLGSTEKRRK